MIKISIIIPAFNEERFIGPLLEKVIHECSALEGVATEVILVDDGSTDDTALIALKYPTVKLIKQPNLGKGAAVQKGIANATGDYILIQDADLEYDVSEYPNLISLILKGPVDKKFAIYGSRYLNSPSEHTRIKLKLKPLAGQAFGPWLANYAISIFVLFLYGRWISDTLTGYKIYPAEFFKNNPIKSSGFEADHEITAKLLKKKYKIYEVAIKYIPRTKNDGKKIRSRDGFIALGIYLKERFIH